MIQTDYRGFDITYEERDGYEGWKCVLNNRQFRPGEKLSVVKKKIDQFLKKESEFKNLSGFVRGWSVSPKFEKVTITSVASDKSGVWVKDKIGKRSKENTVFKDIKANEEKIQEIYSLRNKVRELHNKINETEKSLEKYDFGIKS